MRIAVLFKSKEDGVVRSYKLYDMPLEELQKKVDEYNSRDALNNAIVVNDQLIIEALEIKESTETVFSMVKNMVEEFEDLKSSVDNSVERLGYMINEVKSKVEELEKE